MESQASAPVPAPGDLTFRSVKRRKIYRRREDSPPTGLVPLAAAPLALLADSSAPLHPPHARLADALASGPSQTTDADTNTDTDTDSAPTATLTSTTAQPLLRHKLASKLRRRPGIEFCNTRTGVSTAATVTAVPSDITALDVPRAETAADIAARRFAPQTGVATDTHGAHMAAYIDSRLALLRAEGDTTAASRLTDTHTSRSAAPAISASMAATRRAPATVGRLQEIDLGPAAAQRNEAATLAATQQQQQQQPHGITRTSKDKAPIRRRGRARRTSADVARDAIVEALMAENRLDHYDPIPATAPHAAAAAGGASAIASAAGADEDLAADERVAAEFTRDFLDAAQARRDARPLPAPSAGAGGSGGGKKKKTGPGDAPRGPKLGGSRSARAAMRAQAEAAKAANKAGR